MVSSNVVDECCTAESIVDYFANKYKELYSSVAYNYQEMSGYRKRSIILFIILDLIQSALKLEMICASGVKKLKPGKNEGAGGISSDHVVNADIELYPHIASLFSCMLTHGIATGDLFIITSNTKSKEYKFNKC